MISANNTFYFPDQTIPETKKTKEWHVNHAIGYVISDRNSFDQNGNDSMSKILRAYLCIQSPEEKEKIKCVTEPHKNPLGVEYQVYNLIEQKIEQLVGDYLYRPSIRKSYLMNKKAQSRKLDAKIDMLSEQMFRESAERFKQETGMDIKTPNPEMEIPEDVEDFFSTGGYKDAAEEVADDLIEKFLDVDRQQEKLKDFLVDYFLYDRTCGTIEVENGKVVWKKDDAFLTDYDRNPEKNIQDDPEWYIKGKFMTENDIYNSFKLTKDEKSAIKKEFTALSNYSKDGNGMSSAGKDMAIGSGYGNQKWYVKENNTFRIFVVDMSWKSTKLVRAKEWVNKEGIEVKTLINHKARIKSSEKEIIEHLEVPRHVVLAGPNVCLSWGVEESRMYSISNPLKCRLNRVAIDRQNTVGINTSRSIGQKLYEMQNWCSEILFEIRFAMRRNKGKAFVYDTAQTPKAYLKGAGNPLDRVLHHIGKDQIIFINSKERKNNYSFNQFTTVDLSMNNHIQSLIEGLTMVEELADKMIGFTPGRQGNAGEYTNSSNVDSQRRASFSRTEIYYRPFDDFVKSMLEIVLMKCKEAYKENEVIQYILGDLKTKFLQIKKPFFDSDIGLFFGDPSKDMRKKEIIDSIATQSLGNAQTPDMISALIDVLFEDTAVEARKKLQATVDTMKEMADQREQAANEAQQMAVQQKEADDQRKDETIKRGQDKDIVVADIYADNKAETEAMKLNSNERIKLAEQNIKKTD
tara:strand:- start:65999 stop:68233 length:2235 start_codon:yes stop_codon:yes gene_type:complete